PRDTASRRDDGRRGRARPTPRGDTSRTTDRFRTTRSAAARPRAARPVAASVFRCRSCRLRYSNSRRPTVKDTFMQMPGILYGTAWKKWQTESLVRQALAQGFRGIDTACQPKHYHEPGVGDAVAAAIAGGDLKREELFLQTKFTSVGGQDPARIPYDPNTS